MTESNSAPTRQMVAIFERAIKRHYLSNSLVVVGLLSIILGGAVAVEPEILVWVMALTFVAVGTMMLVAAVFIRRFVVPSMQGFAAGFRSGTNEPQSN